MCILDETWANRRVKCECVPRLKNDSRHGCPFESILNQVIEPKIDLSDAAMTERHLQSQKSLTLNE